MSGMAYTVDFTNVSTVGLESSPVAAALAGLRANEARYFKNKYAREFSLTEDVARKLAVIWDLAAAIMVCSRRASWCSNLGRGERAG